MASTEIIRENDETTIRYKRRAWGTANILNVRSVNMTGQAGLPSLVAVWVHEPDADDPIVRVRQVPYLDAEQARQFAHALIIAADAAEQADRSRDDLEAVTV